MTAPSYRVLGRDAGGCSEACSEMHTYSWPCELSVLPPDQAGWQRAATHVLGGLRREYHRRPLWVWLVMAFVVGMCLGDLLQLALGIGP